jgi:hypothetical protein
MASPEERPKLTLWNISRPPRVQANPSALSRITAAAARSGLPAMQHKVRETPIFYAFLAKFPGQYSVGHEKPL